MSIPNEPSSADDVGLTSLTAARSWDWLFELCRPLHVDVEVVDRGGAASLPLSHDGSSGRIAQLLSSDVGTGLRASVSMALRSRQAQFVRAQSVEAVCVPLTHRGHVAGTLVVARHESVVQRDAVRARLDLIGTWLRRAIEQHLVSPPAQPPNLVPLYKVLESACERGTDRDLVGVFAEALAVWHDIEVVGYVEVGPGVFVREVSLAGRTQIDRHIVLPPASVPGPLQLIRMPQADIDGLAAAAFQDVLVTTLSPRTASTRWLLAFFGSIDSCAAQLLSNYVAALDMSLGHVGAVSRARVQALVWERCPAGRDDFNGALESALGELGRLLEATAAMVIVESGDGPTVRIGSPDALPKPGEAPDRRKLAVLRREAGRYALLLTVLRSTGGLFTPLERDVAEAVADVLEAWLRRMIVDDRSLAGSAFAQTVEQMAQEALERGTAVTAVVLSAGDAIRDTASTDKWADKLRRRMRQSDAVGVLPGGEIGLLLHDTTAVHADAVTERLRNALDGASESKPLRIRAIGFATRLPGQVVAGGILQDARANARQQAARNN